MYSVNEHQIKNYKTKLNNENSNKPMWGAKMIDDNIETLNTKINVLTYRQWIGFDLRWIWETLNTKWNKQNATKSVPIHFFVVVIVKSKHVSFF